MSKPSTTTATTATAATGASESKTQLRNSFSSNYFFFNRKELFLFLAGQRSSTRWSLSKLSTLSTLPIESRVDLSFRAAVGGGGHGWGLGWRKTSGKLASSRILIYASTRSLHWDAIGVLCEPFFEALLYKAQGTRSSIQRKQLRAIV